jgi:sulfide:quinone oxidoreductase
MEQPLHVLVVGAGVAGLEAALALRDLAEDRVEVELLAPEDDFVYRPLSVAEPFRQGEARRFPLARLAELAGARLTRGTLASLDLDSRRATTAEGDVLEWDVLLVTLGARTREGIPGGLTFRGPEDRAALTKLVEDGAAGGFGHLTFALPTLAAWPLPLYELALMARTRLEESGATGVQIDIVTPEDGPLAIFGREASSSVRDLLEQRNIGLRTHTTPVVYRDGALVVVPGRAIRTDRVVSLPIPQGRRIPGLPDDGRGFVQTDQFGAVEGRDDVYAAGDITAFPLKQGGIATQQADAAAAAIASLAGADVDPQPFRPVLRGLLLTGLTPQFLTANLLDDSSEAHSQPLWWPPAKIVGRYLAPFLAEHIGLSAPTAVSAAH